MRETDHRVWIATPKGGHIEVVASWTEDVEVADVPGLVSAAALCALRRAYPELCVGDEDSLVYAVKEQFNDAGEAGCATEEERNG